MHGRLGGEWNRARWSTDGTSPATALSQSETPVQLLARDAAAADPGAAEVWGQTRRETLTAMSLSRRTSRRPVSSESR